MKIPNNITLTVDLQVFTFREGMLSRFGHDLVLGLPAHLHVQSNAVNADALDLRVAIELAHMHIHGAMQDGAMRTDLLSEADKTKIMRAYADEVVELKRHPQASFYATLTDRVLPSSVHGELDLHGVRHALSVTLRSQSDTLFLLAEFVPSQWSIRPYRAMAGTLRVADRLRVTAKFPIPSP